MSSTTNQLVTTTTITLGAGTVSKPQAVSSALTGSTGLVNGVQAAAGDYLLVELSRDATDTATGEMKVPVYGIEITFS